ncbi:MAG: hypothetical protein JO236_02920 [Mycobacterium sp.]|uniref:hypothetical protein n=1 Tax=Mycobacterium sp. TaxID=1785 RepID=UPI001EC198EC|nr:hypothetical protein [Mycobacterium sp.]MBW0016488.1 hypothetical protein [Mycobacterium sp.]
MGTSKIGFGVGRAARAAGLAAVGAAVAFGLGTGMAHASPATQVHASALKPVTMYGDPTAAATYWRKQSLDDCALMAAADVIGQLTGHEPTESEIIAVAQRLPSQAHRGPIYTLPSDLNDPNRTGHGTDPSDLPVLFAQYGITAAYSTPGDSDSPSANGAGSGIDALEHYLAAGRMVIVGVNAELIWGEPVEVKDRAGDPMADHAVVVTGIDVANRTVHLNDSGTREGRDEVVPIELFAKSWATGGNEMTVTE